VLMLRKEFNPAVLFLIFALGLMGFWGTALISAPPAYAEDIEDINFNKYEAEDFTIHYPDSWELQTEEDQHGKIAVFSEVPGGYPNINIVQQWDVDMTLSEYVDFNLAEMEGFEGFELKKNEERKLNETEAQEMEFIHDEMYTTLRQRQIILIDEDDAFVLTHTDMEESFADNIDVFQHITEEKFEFNPGD